MPERVLYEILIQAGHVVDLHIPCDKETGRPKGFAFAEYETEAIAQYAVRLFSGLVRLNGKTLKFAVCFFFCNLQYIYVMSVRSLPYKLSLVIICNLPSWSTVIVALTSYNRVYIYVFCANINKVKSLNSY